MISPYRTYYSHEVIVNLQSMSGMEEILLEIHNRLRYGKKTLPRSFLRASCNRNGVSRTFMLGVLTGLGWIGVEKGYPYKLLKRAQPPEFHSYNTWLQLGYQVKKGATSYATVNGMYWTLNKSEALFSAHQVVKRIV